MRFVFHDFKSTDEQLLIRGSFLSISALRVKFLAIEVYRCYYGLNHVYLNELFERSPSHYNLRDPYCLVQPTFRTMKYGFRSFRYFGAKVWNTLPAHLKGIDNLASFKTNITHWCLTADLSHFDMH